MLSTGTDLTTTSALEQLLEVRTKITIKDWAQIRPEGVSSSWAAWAATPAVAPVTVAGFQ